MIQYRQAAMNSKKVMEAKILPQMLQGKQVGERPVSAMCQLANPHLRRRFQPKQAHRKLLIHFTHF